jgi:hypothetical protein
VGIPLNCVITEDDSTHPSGCFVRDSGTDLGDNSEGFCDRIIITVSRPEAP